MHTSSLIHECTRVSFEETTHFLTPHEFFSEKMFVEAENGFYEITLLSSTRLEVVTRREKALIEAVKELLSRWNDPASSIAEANEAIKDCAAALDPLPVRIIKD